ncbi:MULTISPECIES: dihydrodipicolinate synthase family protein [Prauserella salsuginis group]|uniref:Dihydrodipicolinate synthase family protein n=1 Tax=Prauserella salsuginis TaxID=387889 RepID=A0ABW6G8L9_9PSEU|nr:MULTISPECIES: dihydrodipicolinate synthase family protein [Prauserella salsuginis group]MCR3722598.1 4-hydroxy-tetrahydrodipicolinate synthase [Prauserella flava]MCR3737040.1 4-hydroxy-tetrahydrodipicolinate synthase [Prauserella salsuginis]
MTEQLKPWRGIHVASALQFNDDLSVDYDGFAEHVQWLAASGMHGITPNGSLGEYQTLTAEERARVVTTAVEAAPDGFHVMPGVAAYGALETRRWVEQAAESGAHSVLLLPPNVYRADKAAIVEHYRIAAEVGIPIVAYNNPFDTKIDLSPALLAELHAEGHIVAVKEFTGDVRRAYEISELAPDLDLLVGTDDVVLELGLAGAVGWIAGYPNALPTASLELYNLATSGDPADIAKALPMYRDVHSLLRWDSKTEFVQAIKLSMDVAGRKGGTCRPPRSPLAPEVAEQVVADTKNVLAKGYK